MYPRPVEHLGDESASQLNSMVLVHLIGHPAAVVLDRSDSHENEILSAISRFRLLHRDL